MAVSGLRSTNAIPSCATRLCARCQHVRVRCQGDWGRGTGGGESVRLFCWWSLIVQKETHSHAEMKQLNTQRRARSLSIIKTKLPLWTKWPGLGKMKIKKKQQHMTIFLHTNAGLAVWFLVFSFSFQLLISHPHPPHPTPTPFIVSPEAVVDISSLYRRIYKSQ